MAVIEFQIATQAFSTRPFADTVAKSGSADLPAEQKARQKLSEVRDRMSALEAESWLDTPGAIED